VTIKHTRFASEENGFAGDGHPAVIGRRNCVAANFKKKDVNHKEQHLCSLFIISFIKQQCVQKLKKTNVIHALLRTVNCVGDNALNHIEFVEFL
jgi:hypothetical protein